MLSGKWYEINKVSQIVRQFGKEKCKDFILDMRKKYGKINNESEVVLKGETTATYQEK